ncbi:MAG TPA: hypothetical protein VK849_00995 [Longimicrobiales bacterium]|nr:hypothetical protein [Longimicrobiales bacterium]
MKAWTVRRRGVRPDRRSRWAEAATRLGGTLVEGKRSSADRVDVGHGPWTVTLDTYVVSTGNTAVTYTRARAFAPGWRGLRLTVRRRNWLDRLAEALGWASRLPVARPLTERYVVKGKPPSRVPSVFADAELGGRILDLQSVRLEVKRPSRKERRRHGESAAEVTCRTTGVILDVERLVGMVDVVRSTLDALQRVGEVGVGGAAR